MIVAAGLTPAWQQIMLFDHFRPGEVNRAREVHWCGSGKVLNVGLALHHLGGPSQTLSLIGGRAHEAIEAEFASLGVPRRWIVSGTPTRVCTTILDQATGTMTELVENAAPVATAELEAFKTALAEEARQAELVILTGSLPAGVQPSFFRELLKLTACPAILDIRGPDLLAALPLRPLMVKPNREELAKTVNLDLRDDAQLHAIMQELNDRGAQWVVVTQGGGPVWASHERRFYRFDPPRIRKIVNPIGCGDCLAAGIAWALRTGKDPIEAIRFGIGAAAVNLTQLLPGRLDPAEVGRQAARVNLAQS